LTFNIFSPAEIKVTDPNGRSTGYDPITGQIITEIPFSWYGKDGGISDLENPDAPPLETFSSLLLSEPIDGTYRVTVTGSGDGGPYTLVTSGQDSQGGHAVQQSQGTIQPGVQLTYYVGYSTIDSRGMILRRLHRLYSTGAYFMVGGYRASTSMDVSESITNPSGLLKFNYRTSTKTCYLSSTSIDRISMSSDNTMVIRGTATVNNQPGYTFIATAIDKGSPGSGLDQFGIEVKDPKGNVFFSCPVTTISGGDLVISIIN
jgi:hypothetical protein